MAEQQCGFPERCRLWGWQHVLLLQHKTKPPLMRMESGVYLYVLSLTPEIMFILTKYCSCEHIPCTRFVLLQRQQAPCILEAHTRDIAISGLGHAKPMVRLWRKHNSTRRSVRVAIQLHTGHELISGRYIRLTSDRPSQEGWIFSRVPLTATNWEVGPRALYTTNND